MEAIFVRFATADSGPVYVNIKTVVSLRKAPSKLIQGETDLRTLDGQVIRVTGSPEWILDEICKTGNRANELETR